MNKYMQSEKQDAEQEDESDSSDEEGGEEVRIAIRMIK